MSSERKIRNFYIVSNKTISFTMDAKLAGFALGDVEGWDLCHISSENEHDFYTMEGVRLNPEDFTVGCIFVEFSMGLWKDAAERAIKFGRELNADLTVFLGNERMVLIERDDTRDSNEWAQALFAENVKEFGKLDKSVPKTAIGMVNARRESLLMTGEAKEGKVGLKRKL